MNELKKQQLEQFWSIYETDGSIQALSWLESLKYYEEFWLDDIKSLTNKFSKL
jgi:hypothetical protein